MLFWIFRLVYFGFSLWWFFYLFSTSGQFQVYPPLSVFIVFCIWDIALSSVFKWLRYRNYSQLLFDLQELDLETFSDAMSRLKFVDKDGNIRLFDKFGKASLDALAVTASSLVHQNKDPESMIKETVNQLKSYLNSKSLMFFLFAESVFIRPKDGDFDQLRLDKVKRFVSVAMHRHKHSFWQSELTRMEVYYKNGYNKLVGKPQRSKSQIIDDINTRIKLFEEEVF